MGASVIIPGTHGLSFCLTLSLEWRGDYMSAVLWDF
jgi:hypothetical protein